MSGYAGTRVVPFATAAEIIAGTQGFKAIDPKQLKLSGIGISAGNLDSGYSDSTYGGVSPIECGASV